MTFALVDDGCDALCDHVEQTLLEQERRVVRLGPKTISTCRPEVTSKKVSLRGARLRGVLFRSEPPARCPEARASWLRALEHDSVVAINRADPEAWSYRSEWTVWYRRFSAAGLPVVPLELEGDAGGRRCLCCEGRIVYGPSRRVADAAASVLMRHGVSLAQIDLDDDDSILGCTTRPIIPDAIVPVVGRVIVERFTAALHDA